MIRVAQSMLQFTAGFVCIAVLVSGFAGPLFAQAVTGAQVSGQVTDPTGAAVPDATVVMTQTETHFSRSTNTDSQGSYNLPNLPVGPYILSVTAQGFKGYEQKGIVLEVGTNIQA